MLGRFSAKVTICSRSAVESDRVGRLRRLSTKRASSAFFAASAGEVERLRVRRGAFSALMMSSGERCSAARLVPKAAGEGPPAARVVLARVVGWGPGFDISLSPRRPLLSPVPGGGLAGRPGLEWERVYLDPSRVDVTAVTESSILPMSRRSTSVRAGHLARRRRDGDAGKAQFGTIMQDQIGQQRSVDPSTLRAWPATV